MRKDSYVDSIFFTIDKARSVGFLFAYNFIFIIIIYAILQFLPFILISAIVVIIGIIVIVIDVLLLIASLFFMIFGGGILGMILPTVAIDLGASFFSSISGLLLIWLILGGPLGLHIFGFITFWFAGKHVAEYAEDPKTARIVSIPIILISFSQIIWLNLFFAKSISINIQLYFILSLLQFIPYYLAISQTTKLKEKLDEYDVPEIGTLRSKLLVFLTLIPISFATMLLVFDTSALLSNDSILGIEPLTENNTYLLFISHALLLLIIIRITISCIRGDYSVEVRIEIFEEREDLLEKAKEFRELNEDTMDKFMSEQRDIRFG
jgi:hypothetical protein